MVFLFSEAYPVMIGSLREWNTLDRSNTIFGDLNLRERKRGGGRDRDRERDRNREALP